MANHPKERPMADDKSKRGKADRDRINQHEDYEWRRWRKTLGVSGQQLAAAIRAVGPMVKNVRRYLKDKG
jgi:hypothetical protein